MEGIGYKMDAAYWMYDLMHLLLSALSSAFRVPLLTSSGPPVPINSFPLLPSCPVYSSTLTVPSSHTSATLPSSLYTSAFVIYRQSKLILDFAFERKRLYLSF